MMSLKETDVVPYHASSIPNAQMVWVFAPHPDDEVFGCGGTIALHRLQGHEVHVVLLTAGEQQLGSSTALASNRLFESQQAAQLLGGYQIHPWKLPDRGLILNEHLIQKISDCFASAADSTAQHTAIYAPSLWEAHPDHRVCAMAVLEAVRRQADLDLMLYFYEVGAPLRTNCLVDVSRVWHQKQLAMQCFDSQEAIFPYMNLVSALNRYRTLTIQPAQYAEAFEVHSSKDLHTWLGDTTNGQTPIDLFNTSLMNLLAHRQSAHDLQHHAHIHALEQELHGVHSRLYQAELHIEQQQAQLDQLKNSRSWRVTQPLRWFTRLTSVIRRLGLRGTTQRIHMVLRQEGVMGLVQKAGASQLLATTQTPTSPPPTKTYADWLTSYEHFGPSQMIALKHELAALNIRPLISIVMPVYNTLEPDLRAAIASVQAQIYTEWELCICDDASTKPHVRDALQELSKDDVRIKVVRREDNGHISAATQTAITLCTGAYIALLDHDDTLAPHALLRVVQWLQAHPEHQLLYSDEDKIGLDGQRFDPYFKPDFNLGLLRSHNYMCHFAVYRRELMLALGGPRVGFEGAQDYDLALRAVDRLNGDQIGHIPHVLYHWRVTPGSTAGGHQEKSYAWLAGQKALEAHLERRCLDAHIEEAPEAPGMYRVCWHIRPEKAPLVSIVVPTRNGEALLRMCLDTLQKTTYPAFEVVVVDNGSDDPAALNLMAEREAAGQIRVWRDDSPFNFSALNNRAVRQACKGDWVVLMNNDIEITHPEWLSEMMGIASEAGVGCVGARLWYPDERLQHGGVIMVCGVAGHAHKYLPRGRHGYMGRAVLTQDFLGVTAACLLVSRAVFEEVGGLDETLKVAFNDVDFCLKVHHAGYRNVWTPYAELVHHESVTRGHEDTPEKQKRFAGEIAILQKRWPNYLAHDPCYNPNLTNQAEDFSYAWPPRRPLP